MSGTDRSAEPTRARILSAAEALFATHGVDGVSLREITRASGTRNTVGLQYHFKDRNGLLRAILAKHLPDVDARRNALLDACEAGARNDLRTMTAALVLPWASKLDDADGGPEFLQIYAELLNRPRVAESLAPVGRSSLERWRSHVEPLMDPEAVRLHRRFTAIRLAVAELGRRAASGPHTDDRLFVGHLVDLVTSVLAAPVSEETVRLADERDRKRATRARVQRSEPLEGALL